MSYDFEQTTFECETCQHFRILRGGVRTCGYAQCTLPADIVGCYAGKKIMNENWKSLDNVFEEKIKRGKI